MIKRRTVIATILFFIGVAVYLIVSGAPLRVHVVTIVVEFCLLATVTSFLIASSMKMAHRIVGLVLGLGVLTLVSTWLSSRVIAALNPLEVTHYAITFIWFAVQALVFAGVVLAIDFAVAHVRRADAASADQ
jgi:hypothetical protein